MGNSVFPATGGTVYKVQKEQIFTANGTWTAPTSANFDGTVEVTCVGAGGASGSMNSYNASSYYGIVGGGGGGRVIWRKTISVPSGTNQTVIVGKGGQANYSGIGATYGGYSQFGNATIANYYPDPAMTMGMFYINSTGVYTVPEKANSGSANQYWGGGTGSYSGYLNTTDQAGHTYSTLPVGNTYFICPTNTSNYYSLYFQVPASTALDVAFYWDGYSGTGSQTIAPNIIWYAIDGTAISSAALTTLTNTAYAGTWTRYSSTNNTSPSNAAYARIVLRGGISINGLTVSPTSLSLTTAVSGYTSGYNWTGSVNNSPTVALANGNLENFVIAQGGGAGGSLVVNSSPAQYMLIGQPAWTSGGHPIYNSANVFVTTNIYLSGHGGGAGGNALPAQGTVSSANTSNIVNYVGSSTGNGATAYSPSAFTGAINSASYLQFTTVPNVDGGVGLGSIQVVTTASYPYPFQNLGGPGPGIEGFGEGGAGYVAGSSSYAPYHFASGKVRYTPSQSNATQSNTHPYPNTGAGGNAINTNQMYSSLQYPGQAGSNGIVIVRWFE
jgi:hypothetical protein